MQRHLLFAALLASILIAHPARAANTIQNFDEGASYFEIGRASCRERV